MGFLKSMLQEAGKKTGSAIGNKLFPKSTDYIRLGELNEDRIAEARETYGERLEMEHQSSLQQSMLQMHFDSKDLDHNIDILTQLAAILESLPGWYPHRSEMEQKTYKMAKAMMKSGVEICKRIAPRDHMVEYFNSKL